MGLLDDAIKEHLELKRRRGADPGEVSRQETEALGPVRRGEVDLADRAAADAEADLDVDVDAGTEPYAGYGADTEPSTQYDTDYAFAEPAAAHEEEPRAREPHADRWPAEPEAESPTPPHGDPLGDEALGHHTPSADHGALDEVSSTPPHGDPFELHQPTEAFTAEDVREALGRSEREREQAHEPEIAPPAPAPAPAAPPAPPAPAGHQEGEEDEDVLEETPEFLAETPEHDRLWFEQKPPKDFDF